MANDIYFFPNNFTGFQKTAKNISRNENVTIMQMRHLKLNFLTHLINSTETSSDNRSIHFKPDPDTVSNGFNVREGFIATDFSK